MTIAFFIVGGKPMVTTTLGDTLRRTLASCMVQHAPILSTNILPSSEPLTPEASAFQFLSFSSQDYYMPEGKSSLSTGILSYGNTNETILNHGKAAIFKAGSAPLVASVNATDPFVYIDELLDTIAMMGFTGIQNVPSVGIIEGKVRNNLESSGMGFDVEVALISEAKRKRGLFTVAYVFNEEQAVKMVKVQPDVIVLHLGITSTEYKKSNQARTLSSCVHEISHLVSVLSQKDKTIPILLHGGPFTTSQDITSVCTQVPELAGFCGSGLLNSKLASSIVNDLKKVFLA